MMEKVQKPSNSECYTLSEPFRIYPLKCTNLEDGGNMLLWNVTIQLQDYMVSEPRSLQSEYFVYMGPESTTPNLWSMLLNIKHVY
jgi:hypothetical protein